MVVVVTRKKRKNYAKSGFWWGLVATVWCVVFIAWGVLTPNFISPWRWIYVVIMFGIAVFNARLIPYNYRRMKAWPEDQARWDQADAEMHARLTQFYGRDVADQVLTWFDEGKFEAATQLVVNLEMARHPELFPGEQGPDEPLLPPD